MKELSLSIEEKAKRYDEAIEKLRSLHDNYDTVSTLIDIKEELENIFPELKESEDEKIRKEIIAILKYKYGLYPKDPKYINAPQWIAWLDKQGESYTKRDVDDAYLKGVTNTKKEIEKQYEANYQIRKDIATFIFNYKGDIKDRAKWMDYLGIKVSFAEKQGEQKPAEWSEEDERMLQNILECLKNGWRILPTDILKYESWLKSLKPQNRWQPSDEQMAAIKDAIDYLGRDTKIVRKHLMSLYEDLKKLRVE